MSSFIKKRNGHSKTGSQLIEKHTNLPIKARLYTHDISSKWKEEEKDALSKVLLEFLNNNKDFILSEQNDLYDEEKTFKIEHLKEHEDKLVFTVIPLPIWSNPYYFAKLDQKLINDLKGFRLEFLQDTKTQTFFSVHDKEDKFTAKSFSNSMTPCFVYTRQPFVDPLMIFLIIAALVIFVILSLVKFFILYQIEGYSIEEALKEVFYLFFY